MKAVIDITKQSAPLNSSDPESQTGMPQYELCVQDVDSLVGQLFTTTSVNPVAFLSMRFHKAEAKQYLKEQNTVRTLVQ